MKNIIVDVHVLCYNELRLSKFVLDYWNEFATNVYIYDNQSTDGCVELLMNESRFNIQIIENKTNGKIDDNKYLSIKNNEWKKSRDNADFVVVCDFDEILFSNNILEELKFMKENGYTICQPNTYNMMAEKMPEYNGQLLHNLIQMGYNDPSFGKLVLFDPNKINEINYSAGAHCAYPTGKVKTYKNHSIFLLHFKYIDFDFLFKKHQIYSQRLSDINLKRGWGIHYRYDYKKQLNFFNNALTKSINVKNLINSTFIQP